MLITGERGREVLTKRVTPLRPARRGRRARRRRSPRGLSRASLDLQSAGEHPVRLVAYRGLRPPPRLVERVRLWRAELVVEEEVGRTEQEIGARCRVVADNRPVMKYT